MIKKHLTTNKIIITVLLLAVVGYFVYGSIEKKKEEQILLPGTAKVNIGEQKFMVALADTPAERTKGLSLTDAVPEDGLLFIFDKDDIEGFWMKDMKYSIDIIWINGAGEIIDINEHVSPDTYPTTFYPPQPIRYVLETRDGFVREKGIKIGDIVEIKK